MASRFNSGLSARACGCDPAADHPCDQHRDVLAGFAQVEELHRAFDVARKERSAQKTLGEVAARIRERDGVVSGDPSIGLSLDAQNEIRKFHEGDCALNKQPMGAGGAAQQFSTGATRSDGDHKIDFEGHIHPDVLYRFGEFMHSHRVQVDGRRRASDNWQKGIPIPNYMKSLIRHTFDLWRAYRGTQTTNPDTREPQTLDELCCAILFNTMGLLLELKRGGGFGKTYVTEPMRKDLEEGALVSELCWPNSRLEGAGGSRDTTREARP